MHLGPVVDLQSRAYSDNARGLGDAVELVELADADHFDLIERDSAAWAAVVAWTRALLGMS